MRLENLWAQADAASGHRRTPRYQGHEPPPLPGHGLKKRRDGPSKLQVIIIFLADSHGSKSMHV